jgi:hypothetical protein
MQARAIGGNGEGKGFALADGYIRVTGQQPTVILDVVRIAAALRDGSDTAGVFDNLNGGLRRFW